MAKLVSILVLAIIACMVENYGCTAAENIEFYELQKGDISVKITNYGATVVSIILPDKNGKLDDIVLGYESIDSYKNDTTYFGSIVGRVANRVGNAQFPLNGVVYKLPANDHGKATLHGGTIGFNNVIWTMKSHQKDSHLTLTYESYDGEQGFPGALTVIVTYMIVGKNLAIYMKAMPHDKATPVNLASHTYFNLGGHSSGDILSHDIKIFGSNITPVDENLIPTGEIQSVIGTPFDFLRPVSIGSKINGLKDGYDINYVLDDGLENMLLKEVAIVQDKGSGRKMELWSNQMGVQFYTGGMLKNVSGGKQGAVYKTHAGLCLETQGFPDSVNHPNFPSQVVNPGETYKHIMVYNFTAN